MTANTEPSALMVTKDQAQKIGITELFDDDGRYMCGDTLFVAMWLAPLSVTAMLMANGDRVEDEGGMP